MFMKLDSPNMKNKKQGSALTWALQVFILTLLLSGAISLASDLLMREASLLPAIIILLILILFGVLSDMMGVAITSADQSPFVAMASKRVRGAVQSLNILKKAEKYSNIFNDVFGDIASIVSGTAGATIAALLTIHYGFWSATAWAVAAAALVSAITVSLRSIGKAIALKNNRQLVHLLGKFFSLFAR
jgi:hypothetical protein